MYISSPTQTEDKQVQCQTVYDSRNSVLLIRSDLFTVAGVALFGNLFLGFYIKLVKYGIHICSEIWLSYEARR